MVALGIDFGTSTSVFAASGDPAVFLADADGEAIIPSVLAFTPTGNLRIGRSARNRIVIDPTNTLYSVKRVLGRPWHDPDVTSFRKQYPFELSRGSDGGVTFETRAGKFSAPEVVGSFFGKVREFETIRTRNFDTIVVTVPELASEEQRAATRLALQDAGLGPAVTLSEPVAAVVSYLQGEPEDQLLFVYDFGGGTFDAAIVRWSGGRARVVASDGDSYLGGDDIDQALAQSVAKEVLEQHRWDTNTNKQSAQMLTSLCERAKIQLSTVDRAALNLSSVDEALQGKSVVIDRDRLEATSRTIIERSFAVCKRLLGSMGMRSKDMDGVVLVGGPTASPLLSDRVKEFFDRPVLAKHPPDRVVAMGAALYGASKS